MRGGREERRDERGKIEEKEVKRERNIREGEKEEIEIGVWCRGMEIQMGEEFR